MKKTVVITGVTGSIGKAAAMELAKKESRLILIGRNPEKLTAVKFEITAASGNADVETVVADLSEPASVKKACDQIRSKNNAVHALLNVASIFKPARTENSEGHEYMFAANHLGSFILTNLLLDLLKAGAPSKVITVSAPSMTKVNFDDLQGKEKFSAGFTGVFGATKMMNILFTYSLARRLEGTKVSAVVFHPGLVKSGLTREMGAVMNFIIQTLSGKPDRAGIMLCKLAMEYDTENLNGKFLRFDGKEIKSNSYSMDKDIQEKLWAVSEELSGISR